MIALDASAFLAFLFREKGHERVAVIMNQTCHPLFSAKSAISP